MSFLSWTINKNAYFSLMSFCLLKINIVFLIEDVFFLVHCPNVDLVARIATQLILSVVFSSLMSHFAVMFEQF